MLREPSPPSLLERARFAPLALAAVCFLVASVGCKDDPPPIAAAPTPSASASQAPPQGGALPLAPAAADLLALLGGLTVGDALGPCHVSAIGGVVDGRAVVVAKKDEASVTLEVRLMADKGPLPPASTELYGVFYQVNQGASAAPQMPVATVEQAATALAKRIEATEKSVPKPEGMGTNEAMPEGKRLSL